MSEESTNEYVDASPEEKEAFMRDYHELVQKHGIDFAQYPVFVPDGQGGFRTVVQSTPVSIKNQPKRSPFVQS